MPVITWLLATLIPGRSSGNVRQETHNKLDVMELVTKNDDNLSKTEAWPSLAALIKKSYGLGKFPTLWALEGLGYHYANRAIQKDENLQGLLIQNRQILPDMSMTMLHAGMGLSFAQYGFQEADIPRTAELCLMVKRFIKRCRENSRQGYIGCAVESLGLVSRFEHGRSMVSTLDLILKDIDPQYVPYLWHGAGRATYFSPQNFIPGFTSPMRAVSMCIEESPREICRLNMLAGLGWAITLVNMRYPEVMQSFVKMYRLDHNTLAAISNGVASSIVVREDITPGFSRHFVDTELKSIDNEVETLWQTYIHRPGRQAIDILQPTLSRQNQLEKVFCYQNLEKSD